MGRSATRPARWRWRPGRCAQRRLVRGISGSGYLTGRGARLQAQPLLRGGAGLVL